MRAREFLICLVVSPCTPSDICVKMKSSSKSGSSSSSSSSSISKLSSGSSNLLRRRFNNSSKSSIDLFEDDPKLSEAKNLIEKTNNVKSQETTKDIIDDFPIKINVNIFIISVAIFFRLLVALHSYSGAGVPPTFGDFEAQRHWMEITLHVPLKDWYRNTGTNDLKYWGLDYPPLSAYWAYITGYM